MGSIFLAALIVASVPAQVAEQFDVVCDDGTWNGTPYTGTHLRVDLTAGEWCVQLCANVSKIAEVTSSKIVLRDRRAEFRGDAVDLQELDRLTGEFRTVSFSRGSKIVTAQKCHAAPFSGFPTIERKF